MTRRNGKVLPQTSKTILTTCRGPAKDYLRSLQDRLQETERLLLNVLPQVPDEVLGAALQQSDANNGPSHQAWTGSLSGPEYWSRFQLNRLDNIREWQDHRATGALRPSRQSSQPVPNSNLPVFSEGAHAAVAPASHDSTPRDHTSQHGSLPGQSSGADGAWPQSVPTTLDKRRYSEETRDACEALFSISNPRPPETRRAEYAPPEQSPQSPYPATGGTTASPSQFPKHLFW